MRKTLALLASAALMSLTLAAHADTYTYSETGGNFIYSFTSTDILTAGINLKTSPTISALSCVVLGSTCSAFSSTATGFSGFSSSAGPFSVSVPSFNPGVYVLNGRETYTVTDNPSVAAAATPEPSSLILLGTGILGFAGAARRRFLNA